MVNLSALIQAGWERNAYLACATLIVYEYFIQFDSEVEFFWKQRWSIAKGLFLWNRYYSLIFNISNAIVFMQPHPTENLYVLLCMSVHPYLILSVHHPLLIQLCVFIAFCNTNIRFNPLLGLTFFQWQNTGASLQTVTTHIILELRLWAMYGSTRKALAFFLCLTFGEALTMGIVFGIPNTKLIGTNEPFPDVFICADADPSDGTKWVVYYWAVICLIESILLSLALRKAWQHRSSNGGSPLMQQLTRDSVLYFVVIFWIYLANLILWVFNRITLNELGTAFSFVVSSIIANRLLIAVRSAHYRTTRPETNTYLPSVHFATNKDAITTTGTASDTLGANTTSMELTTFNERTGV